MQRLLLFLFAFIVVSCQQDESVSEEQTSAQLDQVQDFIVIFKQENFAGLNSLVNESNYENSFDVFQFEYDKIFAKADVKVESTTQTYIKVANGCAVSMKYGEYLKLRSNSNVRSIIKDTVLQLNASSFAGLCTSDAGEILPCGVEMVGGGNPYTGKNRAFVMDTGVEPDHPDLKVSRSLQFTAFRYRSDNKAVDRHGHGTHVAGIIGAIANNGIGVTGVAPGAEIVPVKVIDDTGAGTVSGILAGLDFVKAKARSGDVVNMSLGGPAIITLDNAVYDISQSGVWFSIAAGNNGGDAALMSPARTNGTFIRTISAMTCDGGFAFFSNYNANVVDYVAPGVNICSTSLNGGYASYSGTSMAAPHAAGVLLMSGGNARSCGDVLCDKDKTLYKAICL